MVVQDVAGELLVDLLHLLDLLDRQYRPLT
jgi:hypothetical protein